MNNEKLYPVCIVEVKNYSARHKFHSNKYNKRTLSDVLALKGLIK